MFKQITKKYITLGIMLLVIFVIPLISHASGTPSHLSYQGKLTDTGGNPLGGGGTLYYFKFSLWDSSTPGTGNQVWPLTPPNPVSLTVKQGSFNVLIGDTDNGYPDTLDYDFNSNNPVYLQIEVSSDGDTYETLAPRSALSSTAFSKVSESVHGTSDSSFGTTTGFANTLVSMLSTAIDKAVLTIKGAAGQVANLFNILDSNDNSLFTVTASGNVGIGTTTPISRLTVIGTSTITGPLFISNPTELGSTANPLIQFPDGISSYGSSGIYVNSTGSSQNLIFKAGNGTPLSLSNTYVSVTASVGLSNRDGSAATPSYTFSNDNNTGIFRPTADTFGFSTNGTERMRIDANGSIGINTTSPTSMLQINASSSTAIGQIIKGAASQTADLFQVQDSAGSSLVTIGSGGNIATAGSVSAGNNGFIFNGSAGFGSITRNGATGTMLLTSQNFTGANIGVVLSNAASSFYVQAAASQSSNIQEWRNSSGTALNVVTSIGRVGIGTTNPTKNLQVTGASSTIEISSTDNTTGPILSMTKTGHSGFTISNTSTGGGVLFNAGSGNTDYQHYQFQTGGITRMFINGTSGNIGIGTTVPGQLLHISGSNARLRLQSTSGDPVLEFQGTSGTAYLFTRTNEWYMRTDSTSKHLFFQAGDAPGSQGNVLIGSGSMSGTPSAPTSQLTLRGNTNSSTFGLLDVQSYFGTSTLFVRNDGNIGIGTTTPGSLLTLGSGRIEVPIGTAAAPSVVFSGSTNAGLYTSVAGAFGISTGGTERILISSAGNIFMNGSSAIRGPDGTATNPGYSFGLSAPGTGMFRPSGQQIGFSINSVEKVRIDASGNVGIGTTSPATLMHIYNTSNASASGQETLRLTSTHTSATIGSGASINFTDLTFPSNISSFIRDYTFGPANTGLAFGAGWPTASIKMVIDGSGNVGIGTTSPAFPLDVYSTVSSNQTYGYLNSSGLVGTSAGTNSYSIRAQGRILAQEFNAVSDARLKNVQFDLGSDIALDAIKKLQPVSFTWKDSSNGQPVLGFLAQDVELIIPNAVSKVKGAFFDDQRTLDYNQIVAVLVGAVKEIANKIEGFKDEFRTNKLCVGNTCITEDQLKVLLENQNIQSSTPTPQTGAVEHSSSTDSSDGSISTGTTSSETVDNSIGGSNGSGDSGPSSSENASTPEPTQSESTQSVEQSSASNSDTSTSQPESISSDSSGDSGESISVE